MRVNHTVVIIKSCGKSDNLESGLNARAEKLLTIRHHIERKVDKHSLEPSVPAIEDVLLEGLDDGMLCTHGYTIRMKP
jgi:hypothetical protein